MRINLPIIACGILIGASAMLFSTAAIVGLNSTAVSAATNSSCNNPLPVEFSIQKETDAPKEAGSFLGHWQGRWNGNLCSSLIVLSVNKDGKAQVLYSWAAGSNFKGGYEEFETRIKDGVLKFGRTAKFEFSLTKKGNMKGVRRKSGSSSSVIMAKVPTSENE